MSQRVEDVRTLAGQTVTVSFWARTTSSTSSRFNSMFQQNFGSGGSSFVEYFGNTYAMTTSWQRFSTTLTLGGLAGKTIGSNSFLEVRPIASGNQSPSSITVLIWGVQVEAGSTPSNFSTATGTLEGELDECLRYYYRHNCADASDNYASFGMGQAIGSGDAVIHVGFPQVMRSAPSFSSNASSNLFAVTQANNTIVGVTGIGSGGITSKGASIFPIGATGLVAGNSTRLIANNNKTAVLEFNAEL
jgi:hypothetical protein